MGNLDAATIRRRAIVLLVFVAFVATLLIISNRRIGQMTRWEQELAGAGPVRVVELYLTARRDSDLALKMLCLTNERKLELLEAGEDTPHGQEMDRNLQDLIIHGIEPVPAPLDQLPVDWDSLRSSYPAAADEDNVAAVTARYTTQYRSGGPGESGEQQELYILVRTADLVQADDQEDRVDLSGSPARWRIALWLPWPDNGPQQ
ncbi:MAG TPA: hypothetical protein VK008_05250 [Sphingobacteriaceae bacterium]|nr:hypothetical protein [Sphingobacteriaceae bacterium]